MKDKKWRMYRQYTISTGNVFVYEDRTVKFVPFKKCFKPDEDMRGCINENCEFDIESREFDRCEHLDLNKSEAAQYLREDCEEIKE